MWGYYMPIFRSTDTPFHTTGNLTNAGIKDCFPVVVPVSSREQRDGDEHLAPLRHGRALLSKPHDCHEQCPGNPRVLCLIPIWLRRQGVEGPGLVDICYPVPHAIRTGISVLLCARG